MVYSIISGICIACMVGLVIYLIVKFCKCNRAEKIEFIKNFKKGKCALIYVVAVPLFMMSDLHAGKSVIVSIFSTIPKVVDLVVLKYSIPHALIAENVCFSVAVYLCMTLVLVNALMITVSILHAYFWKSYRLFRFTHAKGNKCIIIGNNEKNEAVYHSCHFGSALVIDSMSKDAQEKLYVKGISYQALRQNRLSDWLEKTLKKGMKRLAKLDAKINIVVNCEQEQDNLSWCEAFLQFIKATGDAVADKIEIYVFGNREFEDIYSKFEENSKGCLHYINEYQQIAVDFIDRFPLTEYMSEQHIDYNTSLLKPETEINVAMIGFGRTNQQIFLSMVANNQFLTRDSDGNIVEKRVKYHLFDRLHTSGHKNLNHNYFRYRYDFFENGNIKVDENEYLPLPQFPAKEEYHYLDINDPTFYRELEGVLDFGEQSLNYIIVSLGLDYTSIDFANKIVARLKECRAHNTHVFVRIRDDSIYKNNNIVLDSEFCLPFGSETEVVYHYSQIIREKFTEMAIMRNFIYNIEHDMKHNLITEEEAKKSRMQWYLKRSATERESNIYACLALRGKLHLMGLNCCKAGEGIGLSEEEFFAIYAAGDMPDFVRDAEGQAVAVKYPLEFKQSRRTNLAMQEHSRWNAFYVTRGFVPATKKQISAEVNKDGKFTNGKNYEMRHHGNLTTFEGLVTFRQMVSERDNKTEEACDVIKYDYQLLDGAWWLLNKNGYAIVERRR